MKFAYADPPYAGHTKRGLYKHDPRCAEVDHCELVDRLIVEYPDGRALSLSSPSLRRILPLCPSTARVGAWVKPFASFKPGVNPGYCWEPVIFVGGRRLGRDVDTVRDFCIESITLRRGLAGAKPREVCRWIFAMLGARPGDELADLFPGSGAVSAAWSEFSQAPPEPLVLLE